MVKITSLAIGLLTLISIVPHAQAAPLFDRHNNNPEPNIQRPKSSTPN